MHNKGFLIAMKKIIFTICIFVLTGCTLHSQERDAWTAFWNEDSTLVGFKDQNGQIRIEPTYSGSFTSARKFDKIIAVMEEGESRQETFYLTKTGKKAGRGSIYFFDNTPDCESEGYIRFRDRKTDLVGLLNSNGEIAIPAQYNDLTNVRNGYVAALKGATKKCLDGDKNSGCEHFQWDGGIEYFIDTNNRIIIEHFQYDATLNFYSLRIGTEPDRDANRRSFRGADGRYYSFIDYKNEFQLWLDSTLLKSLSKETIIDNSYPKIYFWKEPDGWTMEASLEFINRNSDLLKSRLALLRQGRAEYSVSMDGLNPLIYEADDFDSYYNNCGEPKEWEYPVLSLIINHTTGRDFFQNYFEFLRTADGYKLISVN